jgi:hypothetical protein
MGFFVCRLLKDKFLPPRNTLPESHKDAKKILMVVGLCASSSMLARVIVFCLEAR